jgi:hypothetical protein
MLLDDHNLVAVVTMPMSAMPAAMRPVFGTGAMMVVMVVTGMMAAATLDHDRLGIRN